MASRSTRTGASSRGSGLFGFSDLALSRGTRLLVEHASATFSDGQKVGVIGRNGCGKSSLFSALMGDLAPEQGQVIVPRGSRISSVAQQTPSLQRAAIEYVIDGDRQLRELEARRDAAMAAGDGNKIGLIEDELGIAGAWTIKSRAARLLHGLGFADSEMEKPVADFSGGWRMRLNLAQALIVDSDLLLLDEPTNHLDLDTIIFLEDHLKSRRGTILCISHDRDFLDSFCTGILHFEGGTIVHYTGNYSDYERLRAERITAEKAQRRKEEATLAHLQAFVDRFRYKATKARQAQSMLKAMDRIKLTAVTQEEAPFSFSFRDPGRASGILIDLKDLALGYEGHQILGHVTLSILPGDRIGLLGRNGQGKSTLIKGLMDILKPMAGEITRWRDLKVGYFAQHEMDTLRAEDSALDHLRRLDPNAKEGDLRAYLGSFAFSGDKALVPCSTMSGGEQARLALALIVYQKPNLLLLDEPTNHLDLETREALSLALATFEGAMVLVSHDRHLLETTCDRLLLTDEGTVREFSGDLEDYRQHLLEQNRLYAERSRAASQEARPTESAAAAASKAHGKEARRENARRIEEQRPLRKEISRLETELEKARKRLDEIDEILGGSDIYAPGKSDDLTTITIERSSIEQRLDDLENNWLEAQEKLEEMKKN